MEYVFTIPPFMAVAAVIGTILFVFISLGRLQDWVAKQLNKNRVTVVVYKAGKEYKYSFSTVKDAAANAIERVRKGENVAYIEAGGEKVWDAFARTNKKSLVKLAEE
jgi:hypothetical protein